METNGIEKALAAYAEYAAILETQKNNESRQRDEQAKKIFEDLGMIPSWVKNGGLVYFSEQNLTFQVGQDGHLIFRIEKCSQCGQELITDWGRSPTLENIGHLIIDGQYHFHSCPEANKQPLSPADELLAALDRYINAVNSGLQE